MKKIEASGARLSTAEKIQKYSQLRLSFLESLKTWRAFGRGWARRVAGVEAESLKMAVAAQGESPPQVRSATEGDNFLTPAGAPPASRLDAVSQAISQASARAEAANAAARRRVAMIAALLIGAAPWRGALAPAWLIGFALGAAALLATQLWAWRTHAARRDALARLVDET